MTGLRSLAIAAVSLGLLTGSAAAQECFLFFCPPPAGSAVREPEPAAPREPLVIAPGDERRYGQPQYGQPRYGEPQYGEPAYGDGPSARIYAAVRGERFPVPAVNTAEIDPEYLRRTVRYPANEAPGTIIIDPRNRFLYFVLGNGSAIRYGIGVGREGFGWSGQAYIRDKQEWPDWYPPKEMIQRQPELRRQVSALQSGLGVPGGPRNPLGPRAMYLWQGNKDTLYRIHGTVEPWTIGRNVSSGCFRMLNQDVIDLYNRTPVGAKVMVLPHGRG
jgi:lipoprotein-anchoring transpeptidase ErfK/SrfK